MKISLDFGYTVKKVSLKLPFTLDDCGGVCMFAFPHLDVISVKPA